MASRWHPGLEQAPAPPVPALRPPDNDPPGIESRPSFARASFASHLSGFFGYRSSVDERSSSVDSRSANDDDHDPTDDWKDFLYSSERVVKLGYVFKYKSATVRKRMLILTSGDRLIYIDVRTECVKGEIPLFNASVLLYPEKKCFLIRTPTRTYRLRSYEKTVGKDQEWVDALSSVVNHPRMRSATATLS